MVYAHATSGGGAGVIVADAVRFIAGVRIGKLRVGDVGGECVAGAMFTRGLAPRPYCCVAYYGPSPPTPLGTLP